MVSCDCSIARTMPSRSRLLDGKYCVRCRQDVLIAVACVHVADHAAPHVFVSAWRLPLDPGPQPDHWEHTGILSHGGPWQRCPPAGRCGAAVSLAVQDSGCDFRLAQQTLSVVPVVGPDGVVSSRQQI
jgi:hypothetical protein